MRATSGGDGEHGGGSGLPLIAPRPAGTPPPRPRGRLDRRAAPRRAVWLEYEEHDSEGAICARVATDVSVMGLAAPEGFPRDPGTRLGLRLFLPEGPVEVLAEVVASYSEAGGLRLRYVQPSPQVVARLEAFLARGL